MYTVLGYEDCQQIYVLEFSILSVLEKPSLIIRKINIKNDNYLYWIAFTQFNMT